MARGVGDAKFQSYHRGDPSTGPDLPSKAISFGAAVQECGQAVQLRGRQATWGTGWRSVAQRLRTALAGAFQPLADGPFADAQCLGDLALGPALLHKVPSLETSGFFPVCGWAVHAGSVSHNLPWFSFLGTGQ